MSDVFLSYAREDSAFATKLAELLKAQGWSVFWDCEIPIGHHWPQVLERELADAQCVIVVWSRASVNSSWVREEAERGRERNILAPILIDGVKPPFGFGSIQALDFAGWDGSASATPCRALLRAIIALVSPRPHEGLITSIELKQNRLSDGTFGPEMVRIPAGDFLMGDLEGIGDESERPTHRVRFARPYAIGRYAVTFDQYDRFAGACGRLMPNDRGWGRGRRPVINITWNDAVAYAVWLSEQTGHSYRLPSEAEWEYAARAGTRSAYWWGSEVGRKMAHCADCGSDWDLRQTAPTGSFPVNPWGLHDTAGNVWEWVQDRWHENYEGAPGDGSAWDSGEDSCRVIRGGAFNSDAGGVRSAFRSWNAQASLDGAIGFRIAQDLV
jgi:formylglycine-generating enzyme required for sulfatase activity